ncbi:ORF6N domain-containing protein [Chitinophaga agrisoli]|uniref:ORF6N domain-containing protein n=1 Tax=Chitinophaga agrisoli TaxID=2607653 RepID=A0A5B2W190_9BACT|nr:ORF6N domain-containing protein [Chitinophaga agrisoli]KAA2245421.1 ORF6N domain-containing protein [Chitinophaga agrisoli]
MKLVAIQSKIYEIRGQKVMLDFDLAELYEVPTKILNQAVKRNEDRFPVDFMFQLTKEEYESLRSQIVTSCLPTTSIPPLILRIRLSRRHRIQLRLRNRP